MLENLGIDIPFAAEIDNVFFSLIILVVGWIAIRIILRFVRKAFEKSTLDVALYNFVLKIAKVVMWVFLILTILERFGFKISSLLTMLAAVGAAIALALKDSLANVAGGIMILVNKTFMQDDFVDINGYQGKIEKIDLFVTHLHTADNKVITIPNGLINTSILVNYTKENMRRIDCHFSIGYDDDIQAVKKLLHDIVESSPLFLNEPVPRIGVGSHGDNSVNMDVLVWCHTDDYWDAKYYLEEEVKLAFDREGITIPYPQMDIHIRSKDKQEV